MPFSPPRINRRDAAAAAAAVGMGFLRCCHCFPSARKPRCFLLLLLLAFLSIGVLAFLYRCGGGGVSCSPLLKMAASYSTRIDERNYNLNDDVANKLIALNQRDRTFASTVPVNFVDYDMMQQTQFNVDGSDVMVFLHVQKTGGTTFEKHLVNDIDLEAPCECKQKGPPRKGGKRRKKKKKKKKKQPRRCQCFRPGSRTSSWLFSRYNTGWKCGLHADWTELTECVDGYLDASEGVTNRRYFYMTFLREPIARFVSEFLHVRRGATWKGSLYMCNGSPASPLQVPPCYETPDWTGVAIEQFCSCPSNMAFNRQTRMLADLRLVNCYNRTGRLDRLERERAMLDSAKANLRKMAFFGLTSQQAKSQFLFEDTFSLKFKVEFEERDGDDQLSLSALPELDASMLAKIKALNRLDVELFEFAKGLMDKRCREAKGAADPS